MQILDLLGMYFDAAVLFVTSQTLLLRLALAILCKGPLMEPLQEGWLPLKRNSWKSFP